MKATILTTCVLLMMACHSTAPASRDAVEINQGYGSMDQRMTTTAVDQIEVDGEASLSWMEILQSTPGLTVRGSGRNLAIQVRGKKSMNQGQPLFVVDGVPAGNGFQHISFLDPVDVQRISILKDAASSASYGSRAADGVILVTLKR